MTNPVRIAEDRSLRVEPGHVVRTAWVEVDRCRPARRERVSPEAVGEKYRALLNLGDARPWPTMTGRWDGDRFIIHDGLHQFLAEQMLGAERIFVAWLEAGAAAASGDRQ